MGFSISPVIANIFIEHFEKEKKHSKNQKFDWVLCRRHIRDMETQ